MDSSGDFAILNGLYEQQRSKCRYQIEALVFKCPESEFSSGQQSVSALYRLLLTAFFIVGGFLHLVLSTLESKLN